MAGKKTMIYTITAFEKLTQISTDDNNEVIVLPFPEFGDQRCAGYFTNLDEALDAIQEQSKKLHDYSYNYCIIEEYNDGLFIPTENRYLFKWNNNEFKQIDEPIIMNSVTNFAMG